MVGVARLRTSRHDVVGYGHGLRSSAVRFGPPGFAPLRRSRIVPARNSQPTARACLRSASSVSAAPAMWLLAATPAPAAAATCADQPVTARGDPSRFEVLAKAKARGNWRAKVRAHAGARCRLRRLVQGAWRRTTAAARRIPATCASPSRFHAGISRATRSERGRRRATADDRASASSRRYRLCRSSTPSDQNSPRSGPSR